MYVSTSDDLLLLLLVSAYPTYIHTYIHTGPGRCVMASLPSMSMSIHALSPIHLLPRIRFRLGTYEHTYIHTYIYIRTYIHIYIRTYTYVHTYIYTYIRTYIPTYIPTYLPTYIQVLALSILYRSVELNLKQPARLHQIRYVCRKVGMSVGR